jgi:hypothetical protein
VTYQDQIAACTVKVAVLRVRSDELATELAAARVAAEKAYALHRLAGNKSVTPVLPGGFEAGTLSIERGAVDVHFDEAKLRALVDESAPDQVDDYIPASVLADKRVFDLIREKFPELVQQRINPAYRAALAETCEETDGWLANTATAEKVKVAEVSRHDPTGKFSYAPGKKGTAAVLAALRAGTVTEHGEIVPSAESEARAIDAVHAQREAP